MPIVAWFVLNWRVVLIGLGAAAILGFVIYIRVLQLENVNLKAKSETLSRINKENVIELDKIKKSNDINMKILKEQLSRKEKQQKELTDITKEILNDDSSKDCPVSDSIRNLFGRLRSDSKNQN